MFNTKAIDDIRAKQALANQRIYSKVTDHVSKVTKASFAKNKLGN